MLHEQKSAGDADGYRLRGRIQQLRPCAEHAEIFARWIRQAEDYRAETLKAGRAELGLSYGDSRRPSRGAMVATDWASLYSKAPADLVPAGYAISGVFDFAPLVGISDLKLDVVTRAMSRRSIS